VIEIGRNEFQLQAQTSDIARGRSGVGVGVGVGVGGDPSPDGNAVVLLRISTFEMSQASFA
jgi:hypothetical protein